MNESKEKTYLDVCGGGVLKGEREQKIEKKSIYYVVVYFILKIGVNVLFFNADAISTLKE